MVKLELTEEEFELVRLAIAKLMGEIYTDPAKRKIASSLIKKFITALQRH